MTLPRPFCTRGRLKGNKPSCFIKFQHHVICHPLLCMCSIYHLPQIACRQSPQSPVHKRSWGRGRQNRCENDLNGKKNPCWWKRNRNQKNKYDPAMLQPSIKMQEAESKRTVKGFEGASSSSATAA